MEIQLSTEFQYYFHCVNSTKAPNINKHNLCSHESKAMKIHTPIHVHLLNVIKMFVTTSGVWPPLKHYLHKISFTPYYKICYDWTLYN